LYLLIKIPPLAGFFLYGFYYLQEPLSRLRERAGVRVSNWHIFASIKHVTGEYPHPTLSHKWERGSLDKDPAPGGIFFVWVLLPTRTPLPLAGEGWGEGLELAYIRFD